MLWKYSVSSSSQQLTASIATQGCTGRPLWRERGLHTSFLRSCTHRVLPFHTMARPGCFNSSCTTPQAHSSRVTSLRGLDSRLLLPPLLLLLLRLHALLLLQSWLPALLMLRPLLPLLSLWRLVLRPRLRDLALPPSASTASRSVCCCWSCCLAVMARGWSQLTCQSCRKRRRKAPADWQPVSRSSGLVICRCLL